MSSAKLTLELVKKRVLALELPLGEYALFGSVPMLAHGLLVGVGDIDIVAKGEAWAKATSLGSCEKAQRGDNVVRLARRIDIFDGWLGDDPSGIIVRSVVIAGLPYAPLADVLAFKRNLGRPKDKEHIRLLERYLLHKG